MNHNQINIGPGPLFGIKATIQGEMIGDGVLAIEIKKETTGFPLVVLVGTIFISDLLCATVGCGDDEYSSTVIFESIKGLKGNGMI